MIIEVDSENETKALGEMIGESLQGGEIIELTGDVGTGKTTLVKGIAKGLDIGQYVQSPSFTINRIYKSRNGMSLSHYDFYRLEEAGIMSYELSEVLNNPKIVTVIEWGGVVKGILPDDRLTVHIVASGETARRFDIFHGGKNSENLLGKIKP